MDGMMGGGWMMLGMGALCLLLVVLLVFSIAALAKCLFFGDRRSALSKPPSGDSPLRHLHRQRHRFEA